MDDHFERLLQEKTPLLTLRDNKVLCEFSFVSAPYNYKELLFEMQMSGYQPVLAHPERYLYFANQKQIFEELKHAGCFFQLNLLSLAGYYGKASLDLAAYFIKQDWVDFVGTDMHHLRHLDALRHANHMMPLLNELAQNGRLMNASM
jgi:tyrosine-protein phosphatase YwqE